MISFDRTFDKLPLGEQSQVKDNAIILMKHMQEFNDGIESGESFYRIDELKKFFDYHKIPYQDDDEYRASFHHAVVSAQYSKTFKFMGALLVKTPTGEVLSPNDYFYLLESRILKSESNEELCTFLSFKDIVKILVLKIKYLFRGENNAKK